MLIVPTEANKIRLLSIDPGTTTTGMAFFELDLINLHVQLVDALTIKANTTKDKYRHLSLIHNDRLARITFIADVFQQYLIQFQPNMVITETAHMGKYTDAFEGLIHCTSVLEYVLMNYNSNIPLEGVDATSVKKNLNAILRGEDSKNSVREKILELYQHGNFSTFVDVFSLDEHSIDAIAVGWYKLTKIIEVYYGQRYHYHKNDYRSFNCRSANHC